MAKPRRPLPTAFGAAPFTTRQAFDSGVGRGVLSGAQVQRVHTSVYLAAGVPPSFEARMAAARLALPVACAATGVTALWCYEVRIGREPATLRFLTVHPHQVRRPGLTVSRTTHMPGVRMGSVIAEHAFCAAATEVDLVDLVAAGDWLVRLRLSTPEKLAAYASTYRGRGAAAARRAAGYVRTRVDSVRETRLRMCIVLAGLPEPRCNVTLGTDDHAIGRVDLLLEEFRLILEYEGDQHRTDVRQWNIDINRTEEFSIEGFRVLRVTAEHMRQARALVKRIHAAMVAGGYDGPPPTFTSEWCALFERFAR